MRPTTARTVGPAVAGAHVRRAGGGQGRHRLRPDLGRAAAEPAVGREAVGGDRNLGIVLAHRCHYSTGPARISESGHTAQPEGTPVRMTTGDPGSPRWSGPSPRRPRWPSTPRPGRCGRRGSRSSATAPANPTSPRPTTSWRRPSKRPPSRPRTTTRRSVASSRLREAVAAKTGPRLRLRVSPAQVLITNGGKQAIANAFLTLLDPGDEVIVPAPYWVTFPEAIALAGGVPVPIRTSVDDGFRVTVDQLEASLHASAPRPCCSCRRRTRPAPSTAETRWRPSAAWPSTGACGWSPTRCTSTSSTAAARRRPCPWSCPSWPTAAWSSTPCPRPTP